MTKEELIRMAREAGWEYADDDRGFEPLWHFAALVAAAAVRETSAEYRLGWNDGAMMEREECAKLADAELRNLVVLTSWPGQSSAAFNIAKAIRARGQE
jgi:hypothetical protein